MLAPASHTPSNGTAVSGAGPNGKSDAAATRDEQGAIVHTMLALANDRTDAGRRQLFEVIGELLKNQDITITQKEREIAIDILRQLIESVSREMRYSLAQHLASHPDTPREMARMLANDEIEFAEPVLMKSSALLDDDLIDIIKISSKRHMLAIAKRRHLSTEVSDVLVEKGAPDVIKTLLLNHGAKISRATMEYIAEESKSYDMLQSPLIQRKELPWDVAVRMCEWVSQQLMEAIKVKFKVDDKVLRDAIAKARTQAASASSKGDEALESIRLARKIELEGAATTQLMMHSLRRGEVALFEALLFVKCAGPSFQTIRRQIYVTNGSGLAAIAIHIGLSRQEFAEMYNEVHKTSGTAGFNIQEAVRYYDQISPPDARILIDSWTDHEPLTPGTPSRK